MTPETDRVLEMLSVALSMENKGKSFYEKAIAECKNSLGKDIFTKLRDDELIHVDRIKVIYAEIKGGENWSEAWKALNPDHDELGAMFRAIAVKNGPEVQVDAEDLEALGIGIELEAAAVKFYQEYLAKATDPMEREFAQKMILEEKDHHHALTDMHQYLSNPESWFEEMEHIGLDGA